MFEAIRTAEEVAVCIAWCALAYILCRIALGARITFRRRSPDVRIVARESSNVPTLRPVRTANGRFIAKKGR